MAQKAECLTHVTSEQSKKKLFQGSGFDLFDSEIVSTDLQDEADKQHLCCTGNLSKEAISTFPWPTSNTALNDVPHTLHFHIIKLLKTCLHC